MSDQVSRTIQRIRTTMLLEDKIGMADGQLLECFVSRRERPALEALVRRHGPMVWGVCLRVLGNHHDAEDAFQATFLVLVRKAQSIVPREMVGNWLYGVAYQTAIKARAIAAKRRARERQVTPMPEREAEPQEAWDDLRPVLDQEINGLPDRYSGVIVLCDLEGKTRKQAAQQLGVPEGTVAGRLARARAMLAKRLVRRGVLLSGGSLAAVISQNASAAVPLSILNSTIEAASLLAAGQAVAAAVSTGAATLTQGVLKDMLLTKLKIVAATLLASTAVLVMAGVFVPLSQAKDPVVETRPSEPRTASVLTAEQTATLQRAELIKEEQEIVKLAGVWSLVAQETGGKQTTETFKSYRWTFKNRRASLRFEFPPVGDVPARFGQTGDQHFSINPAKSPKEITIFDQGFLVQAIYKLDKDTLTLAHFGRSEIDRPRGFTAADAGSDITPLVLRVLKREPVAKAK